MTALSWCWSSVRTYAASCKPRPAGAGDAAARVDALPANAAGAPITYLAGGKQFIAFPVGGGPLVEELIAVSL